MNWDKYTISHFVLVLMYGFALLFSLFQFFTRDLKSFIKDTGLFKFTRKTVIVNYGLFVIGQILRIIIFSLFIGYHNGTELNGSVLFMVSKFTSVIFIGGLYSVSLLICKFITGDRADRNEIKRLKSVIKLFFASVFLISIIILIVEAVLSPHDVASIDRPTSTPQIVIQCFVAINYLIAATLSIIYLKIAWFRGEIEEHEKSLLVNGSQKSSIYNARQYAVIAFYICGCYLSRAILTGYTAFADYDPSELGDLFVYLFLEIAPISIIFWKLNDFIHMAGSFRQSTGENKLRKHCPGCRCESLKSVYQNQETAIPVYCVNE